jgi:hypothetical protein
MYCVHECRSAAVPPPVCGMWGDAVFTKMPMMMYTSMARPVVENSVRKKLLIMVSLLSSLTAV